MSTRQRQNGDKIEKRKIVTPKKKDKITPSLKVKTDTDGKMYCYSRFWGTCL